MEKFEREAKEGHNPDKFMVLWDSRSRQSTASLNNFFTGKSASGKRDKRKDMAKRMLKKYETHFNDNNKFIYKHFYVFYFF